MGLRWRGGVNSKPKPKPDSRNYHSDFNSNLFNSADANEHAWARKSKVKGEYYDNNDHSNADADANPKDKTA